LQQAERIAQIGQPLGDNAPLLIGQRVLIEDSMERGVIVKGANGFFTVSYGSHGAEVKKRGYELFFADDEERIRTGTPCEPRPPARAPARLHPKRPTGRDVADTLWGLKKRGVEWGPMAQVEVWKRAKKMSVDENWDAASKIVVDSWGGSWDSETGNEVDARRVAALAAQAAAQAAAAAAAAQAAAPGIVGLCFGGDVPVAPGPPQRCEVRFSSVSGAFGAHCFWCSEPSCLHAWVRWASHTS
jgi:hypothetical protein